MAGDGTTTATVLAQAMVHEGMKNLAAGANPIILRKGMKKATDKAVEEIAAMSSKVNDKNQIARVAAVSSGDESCLLYTSTPAQIQNYLSKVSQPFLDRIDVCVEAPRVTYEELAKKQEGESSADIRRRICRTRNIQEERYRGRAVSYTHIDVYKRQMLCFVMRYEG